MCFTKPSSDHDEKENEAHLKQFLYALLPSQLYSCWVWLVLKKHIFEACKLFCVLWMSSINQWFIESFWHHQCNWGQLMQPMRQPTNQPTKTHATCPTYHDKRPCFPSQWWCCLHCYIRRNQSNGLAWSLEFNQCRGFLVQLTSLLSAKRQGWRHHQHT